MTDREIVMENPQPEEPNPPQPIRVIIVGDHPWTGKLGYIEPIAPGRGYAVIKLCPSGPDMYRVKLDNGSSCYASKNNLRTIGCPRTPQKAKRRRTFR